MKKLSQWLDEFVSNGADPTDVPEWPNQGGGSSSESVGIIVNPESEYSLKVNFKELKNFIVKNNIDLDAELNIPEYDTMLEAAGFNIGVKLFGMTAESSISHSEPWNINLELDSGQFRFVTVEGWRSETLGWPQEHTTLSDIINMAVETYGDELAELGSIYFNEWDSFIQTIGFHQGSDNTLQVYSISKEDWEKIFILTPANQGE